MTSPRQRLVTAEELRRWRKVQAEQSDAIDSLDAANLTLAPVFSIIEVYGVEPPDSPPDRGILVIDAGPAIEAVPLSGFMESMMPTTTAAAAAKYLRTWAVLANITALAAVPAVTTEEVLAVVEIPAALLGVRGRIRATVCTSHNNDASNKTVRIRWNTTGDATGTVLQSLTATTTTFTQVTAELWNTGAYNAQRFRAGAVMGGAGAAAVGAAALDTYGAPTYLVVTGQKADASDTLTFESFYVEVFSDG